MKVLGKVIQVLLNRVLKGVTYDSLRAVSMAKGDSDFNGEDKIAHDSKEMVLASMFSQMFNQGLVGQDTLVLIGDVGIEEFCDQWVEFIKKNDDDLRVSASGELDTLNLKINFIINRIISTTEKIEK
jgi:hypothetical protein